MNQKLFELNTYLNLYLMNNIYNYLNDKMKLNYLI